jgi:hypothetical protein
VNQDFVIKIGKYKGKTVKWVMYNDRRYFEWAKVNAPSMFEPFKPQAKPRVSDTNPVGKPTYEEPPEVADESGDSWTNPSIFYQIAQKALRERGDL